ncbi:MAG: cation-translocating P-type ATPase [Desulfatitalea sp.]
MQSEAFTAVFADRTYRFCCAGCRMVFAMLMEAADAPDPARFKESDLYRRCVAAGVVPASQEQLVAMATSVAPPDTDTTPDDPDRLLPFEEKIAGMWCPACAWVIATAVARIDGVRAVQCDFSTDRLRGRYDPVRVTPEQIRAAVGRLGYPLGAGGDGAAERSLRGEFVRLAVSALLSANVMMLSWALYSGFFTTLSAEGIGFISWPIVVMTTVVLAYGGGPIMRKAWSGLRHGVPGMEVLIVLGAGSAYVYSLVNWRLGSLHLYFDTAAMLVTLLLLGKLLEAQAKGRVRRDLEGFLSLRPTKVRLCAEAFPRGRYVAVDGLRPGDCFAVETDEGVPADGRVVEGSGRLDVSAVTGEPRPVAVQAGDNVVSGSRLSSGRIIVRAERVGPEALLGRMISVVEESLSQRSALESRTDRLLVWFVPAIAALALVAGVWGVAGGVGLDLAMVRAVTVLVIACPCALGIAIPLARVAGIAGAGRRGLLVRDFQAFEQAGRIDTVVLDKTGTVTHGHWRVERMALADGCSQAQTLALAMGLEVGLDHTIARAIEAYGRSSGVVPEPIEAKHVHTDGVSGRHQGRSVRIGRRPFALRGTALDAVDGSGDPRLSEVFLSVDGVAWAVFYFGDTLRDGMQATVAQLLARGIVVQLISGDDDSATRTAAAAIGIAQAQGGLLPHEKAETVRRLQSQGRRVAVVGDGINDGPALAQADLGIAVHSGAALARHAAGVTLMRGDPAQLLAFFDWARQVERKVQQNLWCALGYNVISLPIAMAGLLTPLVAVSAMLLSSLTVIGNTFMLVRRRVGDDR